jgi:hypothetical protein
LFVVPLVLARDQLQNWGGYYLRVNARLKPGVSLQQATAELVARVGVRDHCTHHWKKEWFVCQCSDGDMTIDLQLGAEQVVHA